MSADEAAVKEFVETYTDDASAIIFDWNGKHADEFEDANEDFRSAVIDCVVADPDRVPLALLVELYRALTVRSAEAWSIDQRVETIARLMLVKGRSAVAYDYIEGARQSFDAMCATGFAGCPRDIAEECLEHARTSLRSASKDDGRDVWETAVERFELLLKHAG
ncbi:MAG: hypothetical protein HKN11_19490 [Rhizobiales bacterium]|nr:hypothetical protein [Hyphomicrobiales bacterium]